MKFVDANEVKRRVTALPEWVWRRADAEVAWNAKLAADAEFKVAQEAVSELYGRVIAELIAEMDNDQ